MTDNEFVEMVAAAYREALARNKSVGKAHKIAEEIRSTFIVAHAKAAWERL